VTDPPKFAVIAPVAAGCDRRPYVDDGVPRHVEACGFESIVAVEHNGADDAVLQCLPYDESGRVEIPADCQCRIPLTAGVPGRKHDDAGAGDGVLVCPSSSGWCWAKARRHPRCVVGWPGPPCSRHGVVAGRDRGVRRPLDRRGTAAPTADRGAATAVGGSARWRRLLWRILPIRPCCLSSHACQAHTDTPRWAHRAAARRAGRP